MARLTPLQRAYLLGYKRAQKQALCDLAEMFDRFNDEVEEVRAEMRAVRVEMARVCG